MVGFCCREAKADLNFPDGCHLAQCGSAMRESWKDLPILPSESILTVSGCESVLIYRSAIVASGLIALVDDCIKRKWHQKSCVEMTLPAIPKSPSKMNIDHVTPKRLIDEVFHRREKSGNGHPSPLRQMIS